MRFIIRPAARSLWPWLPAYLKPINTHPNLGEGQNGKLYGSGPDPFLPPRNKRERVGYARLLYVGLAEYQIEVYYHFSGLYFIAEVNFWHPWKTVVSCDLFIIIIIVIIFIIINFFIRVFSEYTEAVTTSLIPIDAILPEICTFIVGFSCTAWTKMRSLWAISWLF